MAYNPKLFDSKLNRWQNYMEHYSLPTWEELPDVELYMDQVVVLTSRYLDLFPHDEKNPIITPSTVNNYVRLKLVPAPVRKRYCRRHLAYILMICSFKRTLSLTEIQKLIPGDLDDDAIREIYTDFVKKMNATVRFFIEQVSTAAKEVDAAESETGCASLVLHSAVSSMLYSLLTVKLLGLQDLPAPESN